MELDETFFCHEVRMLSMESKGTASKAFWHAANLRAPSKKQKY